MMRKVRLEVDHEIEEKGWDRAARVSIALGNKQSDSSLVIDFKGTPRNPLSEAEIVDKARKLTRAILSPRRLESLMDVIENFEKLPDVSRIGALLSLKQ